MQAQAAPRAAFLPATKHSRHGDANEGGLSPVRNAGELSSQRHSCAARLRETPPPASRCSEPGWWGRAGKGKGQRRRRGGMAQGV